MKRTIIVIIILILIADIKVTAQTYNPEKAAQYAQRWCNGRNTNPADADEWGGPYIDYGSLGGDCAAFVSQCLIFGGLSLSAGTDGNGAYVKEDGVISGATQLVLHLKNHQATDFYKVTGYNAPQNHDVGDPMFMGYSTGIGASHSYICSSLDMSASRLYSSHSTFSGGDCNDYPNFFSTQPLIFFHIKSSIPDHCNDCKWDADKGEEGIDCGDPCPPCEHAPNRVIINTPTNNLPSDVRAIEEITAGDAPIKVLAGQNVKFTTAGTIRLLPGFTVESGGNFSSESKGSILSVMADCNKYCDNPIFWSHYYRFLEGSYYTIGNLANVEKIDIEIWLVDIWRIPVYYNTIKVEKEGSVALWDLITCNTGYNHKPFLKEGHYYSYAALGWIYPCDNNSEYSAYEFIEYFGVDNLAGKSLQNIVAIEKFDAPHPPAPSFSPPANNLTFQNENASPGFTIIPNPNPGVFQLETNFPLSEIAILKVVNSLGATVYDTQNLTSNTIHLPISTSGQHFVVLILKEGTVLTQKMMIRR